ncbi:phospholipid phosphatase [Paenibacillus sp. CAA11]|nr:phosphatase PAP2 family protein [Paenibacillus sp. CAA11]AWB46311.1 phospholipid phosphatase [Paenibacillus sp. CAA11]
MSLKRGLSRGFLISLLCAVFFGLIALSIRDNKIHNFDSTIISWVQGMESSGLTQWMKGLSWIGTGLPVVGVTLLVMLFLYGVLGHRRELIFLVGVCVGSALLNGLLKAVFQRARPTIHRIAEATGYSFPSGHSMAAFTLYGALAYLLWRHIPALLGRILLIAAALLLILGIGISRIYLGVHYPSDVLGGYLASGCLLAAAIWCAGPYLHGGRGHV